MSKIINLVCSHQYNNFLKRIDNYQIDLGKNYTKKDEYKNSLEPNIKDNFVLDFFKEEGVLIYKVAVLGPISVYTYSNLLPNQVLIYKNNNKYIKEINLNDADINIEKNLAELLQSLDKKD